VKIVHDIDETLLGIILQSELVARGNGTLLQPQRTIDGLKQLRSLTGDEVGAQRVAFTETRTQAREFDPELITLYDDARTKNKRWIPKKG